MVERVTTQKVCAILRKAGFVAAKRQGAWGSRGYRVNKNDDGSLIFVSDEYRNDGERSTVEDMRKALTDAGLAVDRTGSGLEVSASRLRDTKGGEP